MSSSWWHEAFPIVPHASSPPGEKQMLALVAYDITDAKRLTRVARICEDFGVRVQYSLFECRLEEPVFLTFWSLLLEEIDSSEDRLVAYRLDAKCSRETLSAGTMACSEKSICYLV